MEEPRGAKKTYETNNDVPGVPKKGNRFDQG